MLLLSLRISWDVSSPLLGIGTCSPGMVVSKTLGFVTATSCCQTGEEEAQTPHARRTETSRLPLSPPARRGWAQLRYSLLCPWGPRAGGCLCCAWQSSTKILQPAGTAQQSSEVSYLRQRYIPLNYLLPKPALVWPVPWHGRI